MNKIAILSALVAASRAASTTLTYTDAWYQCFSFDETTGAYVAGDYIASLTDATDMSDSNGDKYNYAFDIEFDYTTDYTYCDQVFVQAWNVEWTVSTADAASSTDMFQV